MQAAAGMAFVAKIELSEIQDILNFKRYKRGDVIEES